MKIVKSKANYNFKVNRRTEKLYANLFAKGYKSLLKLEEIDDPVLQTALTNRLVGNLRKIQQESQYNAEYKIAEALRYSAGELVR